jgi:Uma2 family endonuclease
MSVLSTVTVLPAVPPTPPEVELTGPIALFQMTSDQFDALPESYKFKLELLDGWVVMSPTPRGEHQIFLGDLYAYLIPILRAGKLGKLFPNTEMRLDEGWTPAADLAYLIPAHLGRYQRGRIVGPADLAIEVLSPSHPKLDLETKFVGYARNGIRWYWIINLDGRTLDEYELVGSAYDRRVSVPFDQPFRPRLLPGLVIDLAAIAALDT